MAECSFFSVLKKMREKKRKSIAFEREKSKEGKKKLSEETSEKR